MKGVRVKVLAVSVVLVAAGVYQLSPLKQVCLRACRSPLGFLLGHWRAGRRGSDVGVIHRGRALAAEVAHLVPQLLQQRQQPALGFIPAMVTGDGELHGASGEENVER